MTEEITGLGSFTRVARALNQHYGISPPIDRRQVETWHRRATRNAAGQPFPEPTVHLDVLPRQPAKMFDIAAVKAWALPGVPAPGGRSYETFTQRNARYAADGRAAAANAMPARVAAMAPVVPRHRRSPRPA